MKLLILMLLLIGQLLWIGADYEPLLYKMLWLGYVVGVLSACAPADFKIRTLLFNLTGR